jgi:hypothetical protein
MNSPQQYWEFKVQEAGKAAARRWQEALNNPTPPRRGSSPVRYVSISPGMSTC